MYPRSIIIVLLLVPSLLLATSPLQQDSRSVLADREPWLDTRHIDPLGCKDCCERLSISFPGTVDFFNYTTYAQEQVYWSLQQSTIRPTCRFSPQNAVEVSVAIVSLRQTNCPFAVKSGGHASFAGASNVQGGLTIDLKNLNTIQVSPDRKTTSVGSGNRWSDVYGKLDTLGLAVIGGRNGDIGVGGLTLGGGISFFSGLYGWACDNVNNYEVVLADGQIVNANPNLREDLYSALRGGGNNFGIVTRFDLDTFEQGQMWGGATIYSSFHNASLYNSFYQFNMNAGLDPKAALIVSAVHIQAIGYLFSVEYTHMDPVAKPHIFNDFFSIPNISDTTRVTTLSNLTTELKLVQPDGFRQIFRTATFKNDAHLQQEILAIWFEITKPFVNVTKGFIPALVFQPLSEPIISHFSRRGGNALGITDSDAPLTLMNINFQWDEISDDDRIIEATEKFFDRAAVIAKSRNLHHRFIYQNYAYITQDVFDGYGPVSKAKLLDIQQKYDPDHVFGTLQPGYFKLRK